MNLTDKVAIVTGGSRGIGRAISIALADAGAKVIVASRTEMEVSDNIAHAQYASGTIHQTVNIIRENGGIALAVKCDVSEACDISTLIESAMELIKYNGGITFMIVSSIVLMSAATRKIVGLGSGYLGKIISFVGTFLFFSMVSVSLTQTDPSHSQVFLYTFFYAGIISGAFYEMNKLTTKQNMWDDYSNGYL